jgi:predicted MFS family arabinose efflux permease
VFGLIALDQSIVSVTIFALVFGFSFLMTAPLTVLFVRQHFGLRHLGAISGLITMVHHICGGLGAYLGGYIFDRTGDYTPAFWIMFAASIIAIGACQVLARRPNPVLTPI